MANVHPMPARPADTDSLAVKVAWLVQTHGFDARSDKVVMLYEPSSSCTMTVRAFKEEFAAWSEMMPRMGARGAPITPRLTLATDMWSRNVSKVSVAGVRMRPDRDFPVYVEDGETFKNTYRRPVHEDVGGSVEPFFDFLDRFLPEAAECEYWLYWAAHKWRHPEVPGISLWYVADSDDGPLEGKYGVGRGFIDRVLHKLMGEAYCRAEDFDILTGTSGQAVYTDWQANCVLVTVDEAHTSPTAYRTGEKRSVYTALKKCLDPAPKRRAFKVKGLPAFDGISYCSVTVATNHANAAAIPASDRRITVLRNGRPMTPPEAVAMDAWIRAPGSIAALARYLEAVDLSAFDAYTPMKTAAKDDMADLALNDVEQLLLDFASDDDRGLVFPKMFLEQAVIETLSGGSERSGGSTNVWRGQLAGAFAAHCKGLRTADGTNKVRVLINKIRHPLFAFRSRVKAAEALNETERRAHAARWGHIDDIQTVLREVKGGPKDWTP